MIFNRQEISLFPQKPFFVTLVNLVVKKLRLF